jgi:hypothetical protein
MVSSSLPSLACAPVLRLDLIAITQDKPLLQFPMLAGTMPKLLNLLSPSDHSRRHLTSLEDSLPQWSAFRLRPAQVLEHLGSLICLRSRPAPTSGTVLSGQLHPWVSVNSNLPHQTLGILRMTLRRRNSLIPVSLDVPLVPRGLNRMTRIAGVCLLLTASHGPSLQCLLQPLHSAPLLSH